jgi:uncharacterized protein YxeA
MRRLTAVLIVVLAAVAAMVPVAQAAEIDLFARLHGSTAYPRARGHSEYERNGTAREVEVTAYAPRLHGRYVTVFVNGKRVGRMLVRSTGYAHREWSTHRGQYVPVAYAGSPVRVRTADGTLVVSGIYHREADDD